MAELAGINLNDFLEEGKGAGCGCQAQGGKGKAKVGHGAIAMNTTMKVFVFDLKCMQCSRLFMQYAAARQSRCVFTNSEMLTNGVRNGEFCL